MTVIPIREHAQPSFDSACAPFLGNVLANAALMQSVANAKAVIVTALGLDRDSEVSDFLPEPAEWARMQVSVKWNYKRSTDRYHIDLLDLIK